MLVYMECVAVSMAHGACVVVCPVNLVVTACVVVWLVDLVVTQEVDGVDLDGVDLEHHHQRGSMNSQLLLLLLLLLLLALLSSHQQVPLSQLTTLHRMFLVVTQTPMLRLARWPVVSMKLQQC